MNEDDVRDGAQSASPDAGRREMAAVAQIVGVLEPLSRESVSKVLRTVSAFLGLELDRTVAVQVDHIAPNSVSSGASAFSEDRSMSPKEFMLQKRASTDVERVAALAYYMTHYRDTPTFKTLDLSKLNTEAAQIKFSNAAVAVNNALKNGFLISAQNGAKRLSAGGELFVQRLPDRAAAREAMAQFRRNRKPRRTRGGGPGGAEGQDETEE